MTTDAPPVKIIRSRRRRKTVEAAWRDGCIELRVPADLSDEEVDHHLHTLVPKVERKRRADQVDLDQRAATLARRYDLPVPAEIVWVSNQRWRWGSCSHHGARIRISDRLADVPPWVLDSIILHELTHLVEPNHGPRFHELMARYPREERAKGYLLALELHGLV